ncbi:MAG: archaeosortase/exosortase family protein, partial [Bryobacteraceae bacterium]
LSSMQFYASYPLRWLMGEASAALLRTSGLAVTAEGTLLRWGREIVEIDAPCSGVRMLWAGLFLACVLISLRGLGPWRAIVAGCMAVVAVLCANIARSTALFFLETGIVPLPAWSHVAVGILTFTLAAVAIVWGMPEAGPTGVTRQTKKLVGDLAARVLFLATCTVAAATAWANPAAPPPVPEPEWPREFQGSTLHPLPLSPRDQRFAEQFPGRIARFSTERGEVILRWVTRETRKLHAASDCFRGAGYSISPKPMDVDRDAGRWSCFEGRKGAEVRQVCERVFENLQGGASWSDVSSWYWSATLGRTRGPWWAVTTIR